MFDPVMERGVLNDFDLARWSAPNRKPSAEDNTGTLPFLALDLLNNPALEGRVRRLYRHDAESFTWCLIYLYICMRTDDQGRIVTPRPHPLSSWFESVSASLFSKVTLNEKKLLDESPLHQNTRPLVCALYRYWMLRYYDRKMDTIAKHASLNSTGNGVTFYPGLPPALLTKCHEVVQTAACYKELSDPEQFMEVIEQFLNKRFLDESCVGLDSGEPFVEQYKLPYILYSLIVADSKVKDQRAN